MLQRITSFIYSLQSYNVHWALDAIEDNIGRLSDIIALTKRMPSNLESLSVSESLLRPVNVGAYRNVFVNAIEGVDNKELQGVALYLDKERGTFRASTSASGTDDKNFKWRYDKDKTQAKSPDPTNPLFKKYPFKKPSLHKEGGYHGKFDDLQLFIGIGFDPTKDNACLTDEEGGLFVWSDATLSRLKDSKVTGDLKTKKRILVCCMFELFFHLMLDARIRSDIPLKAFSPFIVAPK